MPKLLLILLFGYLGTSAFGFSLKNTKFGSSLAQSSTTSKQYTKTLLAQVKDDDDDSSSYTSFIDYLIATTLNTSTDDDEDDTTTDDTTTTTDDDTTTEDTTETTDDSEDDSDEDEDDDDDDDDSERDGTDEDEEIVFEEFDLELEYELTDEDYGVLGTWFSTYDTNNDDHLSSAEFEIAMSDWGYNSDMATLLFQMVDGLDGHQNNDDILKIYEINYLYQIYMSSDLMQSLFAFKACDDDIDGYLSETEWELVEGALSDTYDTDFDTVDTDGDGQISVEEWEVMTGNCTVDDSDTTDENDETSDE